MLSMPSTPRILLAVLAVVTGRVDGEMTCSDDGEGTYALQDTANCWSPYFNAVFTGKLDGCADGTLFANSDADCQTTVANINKDDKYKGPPMFCDSGGKLAWKSQQNCTKGIAALSEDFGQTCSGHGRLEALNPEFGPGNEFGPQQTGAFGSSRHNNSQPKLPKGTHCRCAHGYGGNECQRCMHGYGGDDCQSCAPGYVNFNPNSMYACGRMPVYAVGILGAVLFIAILILIYKCMPASPTQDLAAQQETSLRRAREDQEATARALIRNLGDDEMTLTRYSAGQYSHFTREWQTGMFDVCFSDPCGCLLAIAFPQCFACHLRNKALNGDMSKYKCCQGQLCPSCCDTSCPCPYICLLIEVGCCLPCAVFSTRHHLKVERQLKDDGCDECLIFCASCLECVKTIVKWINFFVCGMCCCITPFLNAANHCMTSVVTCCMQAQVHHELQRFATVQAYGDRDDDALIVTVVNSVNSVQPGYTEPHSTAAVLPAQVPPTPHAAAALERVDSKTIPNCVSKFMVRRLGEGLGLAVQAITGEVGVRVAQVWPNTVAEGAGLRVGMVVVCVDGVDVVNNTYEQLVGALKVAASTFSIVVCDPTDIADAIKQQRVRMEKAKKGALAEEAEANAHDTQIDAALASYVSAILGIAPQSTEIKWYVTNLRFEGCDTPADFDDLTLDELKDPPFNFKRLHLKKLARSRGPKGKNKVELQPLCGVGVYDTQLHAKCNTAPSPFCSNCGAKKDGKFCTKCGAPGEV